eukprot:gene1842-984_t
MPTKSTSLSVFIINQMIILLIPTLFPETLIPITVFFGLRNLIFNFLEQNFGEFILQAKHKGLLFFFHIMKFLGVIVPCYMIYQFQIYCRYFLINTDNEPFHKFDHMDPFVDSLAVCIQFCVIPCIIGLQSLFSLNNKNPTPILNECIKVTVTILIWGALKYYPKISFLRNYDPQLAPGKDVEVILLFVCTIGAIVFFKNSAELLFPKKEKTEEKKSKKKLENLEEFDQKNILFHISHLLENISVVKVYEVFLVLLITFNVHYIGLVLYMIVATPLQILKKYPKITQLNIQSIIFKFIQYISLAIGCLLILQMNYFDGEIDKENGITMILSISLFLISELIDTFIFHSIDEIVFDMDLLVGNGIMCLIIGMNYDAFFSTFQYFIAISLLTNTISIVFFSLFVLTKTK